MTDPILRAALHAHDLGFTPTPLAPAKKRPVLQDWPLLHFDSTDAVREAWSDAAERYGDQPLNLGLALGEQHGGLVDIDLDHHRAVAIASQVLPETSMRSGRPGNPGSHFWYRIDDYDPGIQQFKLPDGQVIIEFRAGGGQTVIPPSLHPDGDEYQWSGEAWGGEAGPTRLSAEQGKGLHATVMSVALLVTLADQWPRRGGRHAAYLPLVGGLLRDADEDGNPRCHPLWDANIESLIRLLVMATNDTDGAGSRIAEAVHTTRKKIIRGDKVQGWPTLAQIIGEEHVAAARKIIEQIEELGGVPRARLRKSAEGDWYDESPGLRVVGDDERKGETPEERDLRLAMQQAEARERPDEERDPLEERIYQWEGLDLGPYLRGHVKPTPPALLVRDDGAGLFYPGRVNSLFGEGGSGKTLIALDVAVAEVQRGETIMFIDFEDEPVNMIARLHALGLTDQQIMEQVVYVHPEGHPLSVMHVDRWGQPIPPLDRPQDRVFNRLLAEHDPSLVVVDGTTSLYRIHGLDTNGVQGTDLVGGWLRQITNGNRRTVILIDHTSKNAGPESGPIGSQHKIAMIQGAALRVKTHRRPRPGSIGHASLLVLKDRLGMVMEKASDADVPVAAEVTFDSQTTAGSLSITYEKPDPNSTPSVQFVDSRQTAMLDALTAWAQGVLAQNGGNLDSADQWWMTPKEIRTAAGTGDFNPPDVQTRMLRELAQDGLVEHNGSRGGSKWRATTDALTR